MSEHFESWMKRLISKLIFFYQNEEIFCLFLKKNSNPFFHLVEFMFNTIIILKVIDNHNKGKLLWKMLIGLKKMLKFTLILTI